MIIKPIGLREPYYKGILTGMTLTSGLISIFLLDIYIGSLVLCLAAIMYFFQSTNAYNFRR